MDIKIPEEQWGAMVGAAVLQSVTQANRDLLIQEAIKNLLTKDAAYNGRSTPLQRAFDLAVEAEARKIIATDLEANTEMKSRIISMITEAVDKATTGENRKKLVDKMAEAISSAFKLDRY